MKSRSSIRKYGFANSLYFTLVSMFVDPRRPESTHACNYCVLVRTKLTKWNAALKMCLEYSKT